MPAARRTRSRCSALASAKCSRSSRRGRSNAGIARQLWVSEGTVEKHVQHIFTKLRLPDSDDDHRRVLAVIAFLQAR
jgi:DNA-binding NarL/FixJ family response regulator